MTKKFKRVTDYVETPEELSRHEQTRKQVQKEFPPAKRKKFKPIGFGVPFYEARIKQGLTWYAVAKLAGVPNSRTIRQIEAGKDVKLSTLNAVAKVLGLKLEVTEV